MTNREIADRFDEVADLLEFQGANPFRVRAYRTASQRISSLEESVASIAADADRSLTDLEGIGEDLAAKIASLLDAGELPLLSELRQAVPPGLLSLLRVPGLGPKKAATLHRELGISSLADLRSACEAQRVRGLKGFGAKTEEKILQGLALAEKAGERMLWAEANRLVEPLLALLRNVAGVRRAEAAGSYRRGQETVGDVDLLVDADDPAPAMDALAAFDPHAELLGRGETKLSLRLATGVQVDLRVVPSNSFGAALQYFTGSKAHNVTLRGAAKERGLRVNEWGVFRVDDRDDAAGKAGDGSPGGDLKNSLAGRTEEEVYAAVGLPWIPPELREDRQEFAWAKGGKLPPLVSEQDLRGDLHMHTTATDGAATIAEMAAAARDRGLQYVAITDHSQRVTMARGLDPARLRAHWREIETVRPQFPELAILKGIECDILERGGMDLPDDVLAEADWVIASVHYGQSQSRQQITERILQALENPHVDLLAHPTGRLLNRRAAYEVDLDAVFAAAKRLGKFLELNANPRRLDLDDVQCAAARRLQIPIAINSDAHSIDGLAVLKYGVMQARRGAVGPADVLNARPWREFAALGGLDPRLRQSG